MSNDTTNINNTTASLESEGEAGSGDIATTLAGYVDEGMNVTLIGGIIGAVVVVVIMTLFLFKGKGSDKDADAKVDKDYKSAQEDVVV